MNIGLARGLSIGGGLLSGEADRRGAERRYDQQRQDALAQQGVTNELAQNQFDLLVTQEENRTRELERAEQDALRRYVLQNTAPGQPISEAGFEAAFPEDSVYRAMGAHTPAQPGMAAQSGTKTIEGMTLPGIMPTAEQPAPGDLTAPQGGTAVGDITARMAEAPSAPFTRQEAWSTEAVPESAGYWTLNPSFTHQMGRRQMDLAEKTQAAAEALGLTQAEIDRSKADAQVSGMDAQVMLAELARDKYETIERPTHEEALAMSQLTRQLLPIQQYQTALQGQTAWMEPVVAAGVTALPSVADSATATSLIKTINTMTDQIKEGRQINPNLMQLFLTLAAQQGGGNLDFSGLTGIPNQ